VTELRVGRRRQWPWSTRRRRFRSERTMSDPTPWQLGRAGRKHETPKASCRTPRAGEPVATSGLDIGLWRKGEAEQARAVAMSYEKWSSKLSVLDTCALWRQNHSTRQLGRLSNVRSSADHFSLKVPGGDTDARSISRRCCTNNLYPPLCLGVGHGRSFMRFGTAARGLGRCQTT
jgi:hypothetical protein